MKTLYIDCSAGISGDMLLTALMEITAKAGIEVKTPRLNPDSLGHHCHAEHGHHGRSCTRVKEIINGSNAGEKAKAYALNVYAAIAKAEAQVHGKTLETVHFHEVGRDKAIENALGIGAAMEALEGLQADADRCESDKDVINSRDQTGCRILVSPIYDGTGFIDCAHGRIPVPVPAVQAMKSQCPGYEFRTAEDVKTEMVTPSGLAALIGIGARPAEAPLSPDEDEVVAFAEVKGTRNTGRGGLKAILYR